MQGESFFQLNRGQLAEIKRAVDGKKSVAVFYAADYNRLHIASQLGRTFLYVVGDAVAARQAYDALTEYVDGEVLLMPEREDFLIRRKAINPSMLFGRVDVLSKLVDDKVRGVVVTAEGLAQYYPDRDLFASCIFAVEKGSAFDVEEVANHLTQMGYKRVDLVENGAEFAVRGDLFDIYPLGGSRPIRIELFGDEVEKIHYFDPASAQYSGETDRVTIYPATDFLIPEKEVNGILNAVKKDAKSIPHEAKEKLDEILNDFLLRPSGPLNTFLLPYVQKKSTILDYLSQDGVVLFGDVKQVEDKLRLLKNGVCQRVEAMKEAKNAFEAHKKGIASIEDLSFDRHVKVGFGRITNTVTLFQPKAIFNVRANALPPYYNDMPGFFEQLRSLEKNGADLLVSCRDGAGLQAMQDNFFREEIPYAVDDGSGEQRGVILTTRNYSKGFYYPAEKFGLIGINDYSRKTERRKSERAKRLVFELPEKGDYVVHERYGIGLSEGIQRLTTSSGERDYYVILYRDGAKLYLPCDRLDSIEKYNGGDSPALNRLGSNEFERVKKKIRESVKKMAIDLLSLYRSRYGKKGYKYQPDTIWQKEMEEDFPYVETDDQIVAISEIKRDMERGKIMDRLLVGDVGYGKTEVAIRAVFKTVIEGKQAAILSPTTILAQQHYDLIRKRFDKFGIKVVLLSRFVSEREIKESLKKIASGEVSVVVATHRILSKDVAFADLGLLVLDEEQRFGVEHKEKLKVMRDSVNILSLSATPIPRTLHMALSGIRDISTLENPPKNRLPVETYVTEYNENLLVDAINKELMRDGQVFVLYNKVKTIDKFYARVRELIDPSVEIVFVHGQMPEEELEDRIKEFYDNKAKVLISTTIIENGIDLPNANTLFVLDSDTLGLSQLYQLRGRVGRSDVPAYAYFTVPEGKVLTKNAVQRLEALLDNTELGSGFRIAMRDLEIRGAGNVLGREQSGQMEKVGYETYLKLIQEGLDEAQGKVTEEEADVEMQIEGNFALSEDYLPDSRGRITFYKRVSLLESKEEAQDYYDFLKKNYGNPPPEVRMVIRAGLMKNLAKKLRAERVVVGKGGVGIYFADAKCLTEEKLFIALEKFRDFCVLTPSATPTIVFRARGLTDEKRMKLVLDFLNVAVG